MNAPSDEELVVQIMQGKHAAMAELVHRYEKPLLRYILRLCMPCSPYRYDILQESFLKLYRNIHDVDPSLKFSTWMYRITHNAVIDHHRKRIHDPLRTPKEEAPLIEVDLYASTLFRTESKAEARERNQQIEALLKSLPDNQRSAFVLRYFEDKDYQEIGDILKENVNTIATWIRRAKESLQKLALQKNLQLEWEESNGSR
jgi:RNA polymerase sigma-70 factor, ECF subfamily